MALRYHVDELPPVGRTRLSKELSHHLTVVLRMREGSEFALFDGRGGEALARIVQASRTALVEITSAIQHVAPRDATIELAFSRPPEARLAQVFEHATELGVRRFRPVVFERSKRAAHANVARWTRIVSAAAGQCGALFVPTIDEPVPFSALALEADGGPSPVLVAERDDAWPGRSVYARELGAHVGTAASVLIVVGPEAGFTDAEREALIHADTIAVAVGPYVLRVETAALAVAALVRAFTSGTKERNA
ncbi:MAG: 16S rRNA (uracil(1498)-N(3))-methyltransferase [Planctomycetes bacterium]|nr:16S rRNA (uracil(1498)-N(3))-methyltransferase [Planctomycetota bacterium]